MDRVTSFIPALLELTCKIIVLSHQYIVLSLLFSIFSLYMLDLVPQRHHHLAILSKCQLHRVNFSNESHFSNRLHLHLPLHSLYLLLVLLYGVLPLLYKLVGMLIVQIHLIVHLSQRSILHIISSF